jgi:DNA repair ATPase RecN
MFYYKQKGARAIEDSNRLKRKQGRMI